MIDLHSHTIFSDGVLIPSELARRAEVRGLTGLAITDHGDASNIDFILPRIIRIAEELNTVMKIRIIAGIEITHVPPPLIRETVRKARDLGAKVVIVHGETIAEPVAPGTNRAALESDIDILSHPGLITEGDAILARERGIFLEITSRKGHSLTNGHVARVAVKTGTGLVVNSDTHGPEDLMDEDFARRVVLGAGLTDRDFADMRENASKFMQSPR